jgi:hypothetical protein
MTAVGGSDGDTVDAKKLKGSVQPPRSHEKEGGEYLLNTYAGCTLMMAVCADSG